MAASDQPGPDPSGRHRLQCSGCAWGIECPAADADRYARAGCPACGSPLMPVAPAAGGVPARNKRLVPRRAVRGGVRAEVRRGMTGLGPDLAIGLTDLSEDGLGVRLKAPVRP